MSRVARAVCPSAKELEYAGPVRCPVEGCGKELASSACLRMHVVRRHQGKALGQNAREEKVEYYCPASGCGRGPGRQPFPKLGQLKQHYQTVHGEKKHTCSKCGKQFALQDVYRRHQEDCQQDITCTTCRLQFRTRNALYQHAKRKGHLHVPSGSKPKQTTRAGKSTESVKVVLLPVPVSVKAVLPLPRKSVEKISTSTQTQIPSSSSTSFSPSPNQLHSSGSQTVLQWHESLFSSFDQPTVLQTTPTNIHTDITALNTASELIHFGIQTDLSPFPSIPSSVSTTCASTDISTTANISPSTSTSTQACQTPLTDNCDFGTQTQSQLLAPTLEYNPTLSDHAHFPCDHTPLSSHHTDFCLVEFGTQTTHPQSYFIDTVDFGTQTNGLSDLQLDGSFSHLLPPDCLEFGTQTLESCLPSIQSLLYGDTRDQSSQT